MSTTQQAVVDINEATQQANQEISQAYDKQVYTSNAFAYASPRHLRAAAYLYGLDSVPIENARILEIGCAGGGNLLPFAVAYPGAHIVGIDLSSVQVEQGQQVVKALGITNLHLHAMSLTDITPDFGQFDYIIAHGVFSWVPPEVRLAIMRIMRDNLAPKGLGYISYNTYPGWKAGDIVRDAMLMHSHNFTSDEDKLASAKVVLNLLSDGIAASNSLAPSLRGAVAQLRKQSDYYVAHEYLESFNNPCYLLEFVDMADQHGLAHVGDADPYLEMSVTYGQNVQLHHSLVALGQPRVMRQQYLDFAVGRNFRKSVLVHQDRADQILANPTMERLADLRWAGYFTENEADQNTPKGHLSFHSNKNQHLHSREPAVIAILRTLTNAWPASLDFDTLLERVRPALGQVDTSPCDAGAAGITAQIEDTDALSKQVQVETADAANKAEKPESIDVADGKTADSEGSDPARNAVLKALKTLFPLNCLRYTFEPSPYDTAVETGSPTLIPGVTYLFQQRQDPAFGIGMYNLWHDTVNLQLTAPEAFMLPHLNGNNSRKQLVILLRDALNRGTVPGAEGKFLKGQRNLDAPAAKIVGAMLDSLKRQGLLL